MNNIVPFPSARAPQLALRSSTGDLLTRKEAAAYLGVAVKTLAMWKWSGRHGLPFVQIGRLVRYRKTDLDTFITQRVSGAQ
jgi:excisionase family DNA binding protein